MLTPLKVSRDLFCLDFPVNSISAGDIPCPKTSRTVSSTEFLS